MYLNSNIWGVLDEAGTDGAECSRRVAGVIRPLVNERDLKIVLVFNETLLVPVLP